MCRIVWAIFVSIALLVGGCSGQADESTRLPDSAEQSPAETTTPALTPALSPEPVPTASAAAPLPSQTANSGVRDASASIDYPAVDATGLGQLVDGRTMGAVHTRDGWLAVADSSLEGRPTLLTSPAGLNFEPAEVLTGLPERAQGPYRLWTIGDDIILAGHVADEQNSALLTSFVARSNNGRSWVDLELPHLSEDYGEVAITGIGDTIAFVGTAFPAVIGEPIPPTIIFVISAQTPEEVVWIDTGRRLRRITADDQHIHAVLDPPGGTAPFLVRIEGDQLTPLPLSQRYGPLATNNIAGRLLAFNEDRLFSSTDAAATWTEYAFPGSSRSLATFTRFGAIDGRLAPGVERQLHLSADGILWSEASVPANVIDAHVIGTSKEGALVFFRLDGLESSVLTLMPWPSRSEDAALLAAQQAPNARAIQQRADPLIQGLIDGELIATCVTTTSRSDASDDVMRATLACEPSLVETLQQNLGQSLDINAALYPSDDLTCLSEATAQLSPADVELAARRSLDAAQLQLLLNVELQIGCETELLLDAIEPTNSTGRLITKFREQLEPGAGVIAPPILIDGSNHWWISTETAQFIFHSDPATGAILGIDLTAVLASSSYPFDTTNQQLFEWALDAMNINLPEGLSPSPSLLSAPPFPITSLVFCFSSNNRNSRTQILLPNRACR